MSFYFLETTAFAKLFVQDAESGALIHLLKPVEDNSKLVAASTPLEVYAAIRRREHAGDIAPADAARAVESLRNEAAHIVQQPLNPAVLEAAQLVVDHTGLRWTDALQLGAAAAARAMYPSTQVLFVSAHARLLEAARAEGLDVLDTATLPAGQEDEAADKDLSEADGNVEK